MIWSCVAQGKKGPLVFLDLNSQDDNDNNSNLKNPAKPGFTKEQYISQVLRPHLKPFYDQLTHKRGPMFVVEDGAPCHTSKLTNRTRSELGIQSLMHPPSSPDLNCIEPLWAHLKNAVADIPGSHHSLESLKAAAIQVWNELTIDQMESIMGSMKERVRAVQDAKGLYTQF